MIESLDYHVGRRIYESRHTLVLKAQRPDNTAVILKMINPGDARSDRISRFRHEYEVIRALASAPGVIRAHALEKAGHGYMLVLEDFGAVSLDEFLGSGKQPLDRALRIATDIARSLEAVHAAGFIHRNINPANIVINPASGKLKIIDFTLAARTAEDPPEQSDPDLIEGTLRYISPEQTGRVAHPVDHRTDFYSLGATLYELLTGKPPFTGTDPMQLVHAHLARQPVSLHEIDPRIPPVVSDLVMKLLAKNPEDRYQRASAITADLARCLEMVQQGQPAHGFALAGQDGNPGLKTPQKLCGRQQALAALQRAFHQTFRKQKRVILVTGSAGIGKTVLVQALRHPVTRQGGFFVYGKYDPLQVHTPYRGLRDAFCELARRLITQPERKFKQLQKMLHLSLGATGKVITDLIPEFEMVLGPQQPLTKLGHVEDQNRFFMAFEKLVNVVSSPDHPLVICLDDLQWIDGASLKLVHTLIGSAMIKSLLVIGTCRHNEVGPTHPLSLILEKIQKERINFARVRLEPLELPSLTQMVGESLGCPPSEIRPLAELIEKRTNGNPFFACQFLKSLHDQKLLSYEPAEGHWKWSLSKIGAAPLPGGIVELLTDKIKSLPEETQEVLKLAACIGSRFAVETLAIVSERSRADLFGILKKAEGVAITPVDHADPAGDDFAADNHVKYRFIHDRIQQTAYDLVDGQQKSALHWKIGRILLRSTPHRHREKFIFDIVNQLNKGVGGFRDDTDLIQLADLNLEAGRKATAANAYDPAFRYLTTGISLLENAGSTPSRARSLKEVCWDEHYELCLALYTEAMEAAHLSTNFDKIEGLADEILTHGRCILDKIKVYEIRGQVLYALNKMPEAVETACSALGLLEVRIPHKPGKRHVMADLLKTRLALRRKRVEGIGDLPKMTDPRSLAALNLIRSALLPSYYVNPNLFPLLVFRGVRLSLRYGHTADTCFAYAGYGLILCGVLGQIEKGYRFGQLALKQMERLESEDLRCRTLVTAYTFTVHWKQHLRDSLEPMLEAHRSGIESGDIEFGAIALHMYSRDLFYVGEPLAHVEEKMRSFEGTISELGQETALKYQRIYHQAVLNLLGRAPETHRLAGECFNEDIVLSRHQKNSDTNALFKIYLLKTMLALLFEQPLEAVEHSEAAEQYIASKLASPDGRFFYFYDSLARLGAYPKLSKSKQKQALKKVAVNQKKLKKWARHSPMNTRHKFELVAAEYLARRNKAAQARRLYDSAIKTALQYEYVHEAALANELAAKFYLRQQKEGAARAYFNEALYGYRKWGATAKVKHLEKHYAELVENHRPRRPSGLTVSPQETLVNGSLEVLDLASVMKASISISKEIVFSRLVDKLMRVVIQNTGAQRGVLILRGNGQLEVRAEITVGHHTGTRLLSTPLEASRDIPMAVVNYLNRSGETLILDNAAEHKLFASDPYIRRQRPGSILCFPLENKSKLVGILYLENNLATGVFTPQRLEVLKILSAQMAASLENARLFRDLEKQSVALRRTNQKLEREVEQRRRAEVEINRYKQRLEKMVVEQTAELDQSRKTLADLTGDIRRGHRLRNMIGKSEVMQNVYTLVRELAGVPATVLITGESGSGKELVAEALHASSHRSSRPFVKVNCSALSEGVLESELFGHVRGAFTGADRHKIGRFQKAADGTVLLDEIGDVSLHFQKRLLRILQEREFERLGDSTTLPMKARVIASTNQDLLEKVSRNEFREDLYYRLKVVEIRIPPLRERREDIPLLIRHFLAVFGRELNKKIKDVSPEVLRIMMSHDWPGNVRELKNILEHVSILCKQETITREDLPADFPAGHHAPPENKTPSPPSPHSRAAILQALEQAQWNKTRAARILSISRRTLYRRLEEYQIK
jgi:predicted ATPase/GAF domain-containing protein/tRNA A-37 threonylcarbamoyl transferase component Bud32